MKLEIREQHKTDQIPKVKPVDDADNYDADTLAKMIVSAVQGNRDISLLPAGSSEWVNYLTKDVPYQMWFNALKTIKSIIHERHYVLLENATAKAKLRRTIDRTDHDVIVEYACDRSDDFAFYFDTMRHGEGDANTIIFELERDTKQVEDSLAALISHERSEREQQRLWDEHNGG